MEVIFLIGLAEAVFLALLIYSKKNKSVADFVLASWLTFIGIELLFYYFFYTKYDLQHPHLLGISVFFPMLQGPFMFIYVSILISEKRVFKKSLIFHALPFLIITIYSIFDFYILPASVKLDYYNEIAVSPPIVYAIGQTLNITLGPVYIIWSLLVLRKHRKNISSNFSYTENINLNWLKYVLLSLGLIWVTVIIVTVLKDLLHIIPENFASASIYISVTVGVFLLGYFGFKQQSIYTDIPLESARATIKQHAQKEKKQDQEIKVDSFRKHEERYGKSGLKEYDADIFLNNLLKFMEEEKPYLDNKLSLKQLAELIGLSTNHLSQIINEKLNKNFFDFINEYRIKEVKRNLCDPKIKHYTLLAIAFQSGFNSKSSFNDIFKRNTGLTPSEFQKSLNT